MQVISKQTGRVLNVPDAFYQANPQLYQVQQENQAQTTQQPAQQQDFMSSLLNFGKNTVFGMAFPAIRTFQNIFGSGLEHIRGAGINQAADDSTNLINQLNQINAQLRIEQDPMRKQELLFKSRQLSDTIGKAGQMATRLAGVQNPIISPQDLQKRTGWNSIPETARNSVGMASYLIPYGKGANVLTRAILPGAIQGGMFAASKEGATGGDVAGGAVGGGLFGGATYGLGKLLGGFKGLGENMRKGVVNPQVGNAPYSPTKARQMVEFLQNSGAKGNSEQQWDTINELWDLTDGEIKNILKNTKTEALYKTAVQDFNDALTTSNVPTSDPAFAKEKDLLLERLKGIFNKGSASPEKIYGLKSTLREELSKVFDKTNPNTKERLKQTLFESLKNTLDSVAPDARGINSVQNELFKASEGIAKRAGERFQVFGIGPHISEAPLQTTEDFLGRLFNKVGGAEGAVNAVGKSTLPIPAGQEILSGLTKPSTQAIPYPTGDIPTPTGANMQSTTQQQGTGLELSFDKLQQILLSPNISDKTKAQFKYIYEQQQAQGEGTKKTDAQRASDQVGQLTNIAIGQLPSIKDKVGIGGIGLKTAGFMSTFNAGDPDVLNFINSVSQIKATIAKARAGTSFTPNEEALLNKYTPNENDSYQSLVVKLNGLKTLFGSSQ